MKDNRLIKITTKKLFNEEQKKISYLGNAMVIWSKVIEKKPIITFK